MILCACKKCGKQFWKKTQSNQIYCSVKHQQENYYKIHPYKYIKKADRIFPLWRCENCGYLGKLDFDIKDLIKLKKLKCPNCGVKNQETLGKQF